LAGLMVAVLADYWDWTPVVLTVDPTADEMVVM
jgi:hypothetical protein